MDDFGKWAIRRSATSEASRLDKIKIDRSFIKDMGERSDCSAIVQAVASLGDAALEMATTAEWVETVEQLGQIRALGCTEVQGVTTSSAGPARQRAAGPVPGKNVAAA